MKSIRPWPANSECPEKGFQKFKSALNNASYHNAGSASEFSTAKSYVQVAADIAIENKWPYWAMERMFKEIGPLVAWDQFMQTYINVLNYKIEEG
jgi:hypothetical protein